MAEASAPAAAATADHLALFNRPEFHALNLRAGQRAVRLDHVAEGRLVGSLVGVREGDIVACGHSAPFGGPDFVRDAETAANVVAALAGAVAELDADGVRAIRVRARPAFYSGSETAVQFALLNLGFRVEACELSFHLDLAALDGIDAYVAGLRSPARRALRHGLAEPFALVRGRGRGDVGHRLPHPARPTARPRAAAWPWAPTTCAPRATRSRGGSAWPCSSTAGAPAPPR